ncbi:esterase/lipase family protein [Dactylosporangium cerinum]|uniref:Esterase/lipase family protein n=1 Tax=Dactylosporangium cerinum TaxID=1434730 RepID=A0ABV9W8J2_9ACTN
MRPFAPGEVVVLPGVTVTAHETAGIVSDPQTGGPGGVRAGGPRVELDAEHAARIEGALDDTGMRIDLTVTFEELQSTAAPVTGLRAEAQPARLDITVPLPDRPDEAQVLLEVDGAGVLRWHFAEPLTGPGAPVRGPGDGQTFAVPVEQYELRTGPATERALFDFGRRKILHLLRFPIEWAAGRVAVSLARAWEGRHRPYGLWDAAAGYFDPAARRELSMVDASWFDGVRDPVLLLVHGTFSTGHSCFAGLAADDAAMRRLLARYDRRVLVFDHPTLHDEPGQNVAWLLDRLPADRPVRLDVVAHSRGGLVSRLLTDPAVAATAGRPAPVVERLVHIAVPNAGTVLARTDKLRALLDVMTNVTTLFLDDVSGSAAALVLEIVKDVATGAHQGLPGLAAMNPDEPWLKALNAEPRPAATEVFAATTDFKPGAGAALPLRALDGLVDLLFAAPNDLVVPTEGVYRANKYIVDDPLHIVGGPPFIAHTGFFGHTLVRERIVGWLGG